MTDDVQVKACVVAKDSGPSREKVILVPGLLSSGNCRRIEETKETMPAMAYSRSGHINIRISISTSKIKPIRDIANDQCNKKIQTNEKKSRKNNK